MRIAVLGARCRRQGTGAHLARFLARQGADVCAVLGRSEETARQAAGQLERDTGTSARPYTDLGALLAEQTPDALVVATPHEAHAEGLRAALQARCHVLCEKPLVWGGPDPVAEAESLAQAFLAAPLHLVVNAQWPFTLPTWRALFPGVLDRPPRTFAMRMAPRTRGRASLLDALPHPLSLLAAVLPDEEARLGDVSVRFLDDQGARAVVRFRYEARGTAVDCRVDLEQAPEPPRPAAYGFDGHVATRHVRLEPYALELESPERRVILPDPTPLLVGSFLAAVAAGPPRAVDPAVVPGMRHLAEIVASAPDPDRAP